MKIYLLAVTAILFSCHSNEPAEIDHTHELADTMMTSSHPADKKLFADVTFADKYDLSCGMPLSAGLSDTAHYKGKVYGFCSPECKADFQKNAEKLISAKNKK